MTKELIEEFDLGGGGDESHHLSMSEHHQVVQSDTVLELDRWDLAKGKSILDEHHPPSESDVVLKAKTVLWSSAVSGDIYYRSPQRLENEVERNKLVTEIADFHAAAFLMNPTKSEGGCADERRAEFMNTLMDSPDFNSLRQVTTLNELASEVATLQFFTQYSELKERDHQREEKRKCSHGKHDAKKDELRAEADLYRACHKAVKKATEEVDASEEAMRGLGLGESGDGKMDARAVAALYKKIRGNSTLRRVCELVGRYRRVAQSKQRGKVSHGSDDVVGVTLGGDVSRLTATELALLCNSSTKLDSMRRLVENQSMVREHKGVEKLGKGPIVVCVDESGSMAGEPVANAKAFALALAWIARRQNRWCALVGYAGGTKGTLLELPPNRWDESKLCDWITHFQGGGTTMDVPLAELPKWWGKELKAPKGITDLFLITDAIVRVPENMRNDFNEWKKREKVKCVSLVIGHDPGELSSVSDQIHLVKTLGVGEEAIGRCLSV